MAAGRGSGGDAFAFFIFLGINRGRCRSPAFGQDQVNRFFEIGSNQASSPKASASFFDTAAI